MVRSICCAAVLLLMVQQKLAAQNAEPTASQVKAVFLYNFSKFVDWPPSAFTSANAPFVIGVLGKDPFGNYMDELVSGEKIGDHPIVFRRFSDARSVANCHILYISTPFTDELKEALTAVSHKSTLTVGDASNFTKSGGMIRFFNHDNKIRLQINVKSARSAQLQISSKLLSVATIAN